MQGKVVLHNEKTCDGATYVSCPQHPCISTCKNLHVQPSSIPQPRTSAAHIPPPQSAASTAQQCYTTRTHKQSPHANNQPLAEAVLQHTPCSAAHQHVTVVILPLCHLQHKGENSLRPQLSALTASSSSSAPASCLHQCSICCTQPPLNETSTARHIPLSTARPFNHNTAITEVTVMCQQTLC
jgi:hypothetical protein